MWAVGSPLLSRGLGRPSGVGLGVHRQPRCRASGWGWEAGPAPQRVWRDACGFASGACPGLRGRAAAGRAAPRCAFKVRAGSGLSSSPARVDAVSGGSRGGAESPRLSGGAGGPVPPPPPGAPSPQGPGLGRARVADAPLPADEAPGAEGRPRPAPREPALSHCGAQAGRAVRGRGQRAPRQAPVGARDAGSPPPCDAQIQMPLAWLLSQQPVLSPWAGLARPVCGG